MDERAIMLNRLAQGLLPMSDGIAWFAGLRVDAQRDTLRVLAEYCRQARAVPGDGPQSIRVSGIRSTHTAAVLITSGRTPHPHGRLTEQLRKIVDLPDDEFVKAFRLLVALLGVADGRRRQRYCAGGCSHEWHRLTIGQQTGST